MAVDIGYEATDRADEYTHHETYIMKASAASSAGNVTSIDIWANTNISGLKIGVFYTTNGNTLKCRSACSIPGTITAGSKVNKVVSLAIEIGDYIGFYFTGGLIEGDPSGFSGLWYVSGDYCTVNAEATFSSVGGYALSLGGYIEAVAGGRSFGFIIG